MAKQRYDEDLFKDSTMTFGEHLEELRGALLRSLAGLVLGLIFGLLVGRQAVAFIQAPLESALQRYLLRRSVTQMDTDATPLTAEEMRMVDQQRMVFDDYKIEPRAVWMQLRDRLGDALPEPFAARPLLQASEIVNATLLAKTLLAEGNATADTPGKRIWQKLSDEQRAVVTRLAEGSDSATDKAALANALTAALRDPALFRGGEVGGAWPDSAENYLKQLQQDNAADAPWWNRNVLLASFPLAIEAGPPPLVTLRLWRSVDDDPRTRPSSFGVTEPFMIYLKASLVVGATLASPWIFYQIWAFVAAGLYPHERRYVQWFGPVSLGLFALGIATAFLFVFEPVLDYLFWFNEWLGIDPDPRINEWLGFVLFLPLGFGISFQLPLVMLFLERIGILSVNQYISNWRIAVISIVVLSAVLTPADPWSMFFMAVPLVFLYGLGLLMCRYLPRAGDE
jgi:sec-independent protein translocase protein TatC